MARYRGIIAVGRRLLTLVVIAASACAPTQNAVHSSDKLTIAQRWQPTSLNPLLHVDFTTGEMDNLVYSSLLNQNAAGRLVPDLATDVPSMQNGGISVDGRTIVYHLRHGVMWQDGKPLTSLDVLFTFNAIMNPRTAVASRFGFDKVISLRAPDTYTIVVRLSHPFASILGIFFAPLGSFPVLPAHILSRYSSLDNVPFNSQPIGSGPYRVISWTRGQSLELQAFPNYFGGKPAIEHIAIRFVENGTTIENLLRTGEADASFLMDPTEVKSLISNAVSNVVVHPIGDQFILLNTVDVALRNARVRRAIAFSIDPGFMAKVTGLGWYSAESAMRGLLIWAYNPRIPNRRVNTAEADKLFDAAGWKRGRDGIRMRNGVALRINFILQSSRSIDLKIASIFQQELAARGVIVVQKSYVIEQFVAPASMGGPLYGSKFQAATLDGDFGDPDISMLIGCKHVPPNGYNVERFCNASVDRLLAEASSTYEPSQRKIYYSALQKELMIQVPVIPLWAEQELDIIPKRLKGFAPGLMSPFALASRWRLLGH